MDFTLILVYFLQVGAAWRNLALPSANSTSPSPYLLLATDAIIWLLVIVAQLGYRFLIHFKNFEHRVYAFIDILTMSNVSLFLLDERFHGYYIHGRSIHSHADTDMAEMLQNLKREEVGWESSVVGLVATCQLLVRTSSHILLHTYLFTRTCSLMLLERHGLEAWFGRYQRSSVSNGADTFVPRHV